MLSSAQSTTRLKAQYKSSANLNARINLHKRFSTSSLGWYDWVFQHLDLPEDAKILELGCGTAELWKHNDASTPAGWDITLSDWSDGMLADAQENLGSRRKRFKFAVINAQDIPFASNSFDCVIANHMLYHVPDRKAACTEVRRILKSDGKFFAATNGKKHLIEFRHHDLMTILYPSGTPEKKIFRTEGNRDWFELEGGLQELQGTFEKVERRIFDDSLEVSDISALVAYHASYVDLNEAQKRQLVDYYETKRADNGTIGIQKSVGIFIAAP